MSDILARICADKRADVAARKSRTSLAAIEKLAADAPTPRGFHRALERGGAAGKPALIAEIKKASPSRGLIRADFDPPALARSYRDGGAICLSVLTDTKYFQGDDAHLRAAREASGLPALRKDFTLDPFQVLEARALGADCILLIMAALKPAEARALHQLARSYQLDVLAEIHDASELETALGLDGALIGINNRNLKTLMVDLQVFENLARDVPKERFLVAESGLKTHADVTRVAAAGAKAILVGESLMSERDVTAATRRLLGASA
jgi:indole-3-glycerol phosphate synthase